MTPYANLGLQTSRKGKRVKLWRNESVVTVGTTDTKLLGSNPRRWGVIFGTPVGSSGGGSQLMTDGTVSAHGVDTSTAGVKLSYTCPANIMAEIRCVGQVLQGGTAPTLRFFLTPNGGTKTTILQPLTSGTPFNISLIMSTGDLATIEINTTGAGSTTDMFMSVMQWATTAGGGAADNTVFVSTDGPPAVNQGMPLHPGNDPFMMTYEHIGQAIREEIRAIATSTPVTLTIWDIFEVDCPCSDGEYDS